MTGLTLFVSDPIRAELLAHLPDDAPFKTVFCVNSCTECCAETPALQTDALLIELSCTAPALLQDLLQQMETANYSPALLLFELQEDGSIRYAVSAADARPLSDALEAFVTGALRPQHPCARWFFRFAPWPAKNTRLISDDRSASLVELMYGAAEQETQHYLTHYRLNLHEAGYYAYYWELNYTLFVDHYCYKDIYHFVGVTLMENCRRVLEKYNGGEVFYMNPTQLCVLINDFRLSSEMQNRRRLNALLTELLAVTDSRQSVHYVSKRFRTLREFRAIYDTYLAERRMSFFESGHRIFDSSAVRAERSEADPKEINIALESITKYLNYDISNIGLDETLRSLFFKVLKPSYDFPMYYYAASVLSSKLLQLDSYLEKETISLRLDPNHLSHSSIEAEYDAFCRTIEKARQQIGSRKQSKSVLLMKAMDFIQKNYGNTILVSDIASALYVSETYLSRIFKTLTGKSVIQTLVDYRIEQAKLALAEEDTAVYTIAEQCGFRDVHHFSKTFKKLTGQSPTEYRRNHF